MKREFCRLDKGSFDLLVIGGGIYGAWTAYDAALRGLSVAIVEKNDWASGTSSASSKLIHGGLRYLENLQISVVRKSLEERARLLRLAPHRVYPLSFLVPIYEDSPFSRLKMKIGLMIYDAIGRNKNPPFRHCFHSKEELKNTYPFLFTKGLIGGYSYLDCGTDDARFTLEIVAGAISAGAVAVNHAGVISLVRIGGKICGAKIKDEISGEIVEVSAGAVVNATGVFTSHLGEDENSVKKNACLSKGVHIVMPAIGIKEAFLFTAHSDRRVFFCIPWYGKTLVGTTDTSWEKSPEIIGIEEAEIKYLLSEVNSYLNQNWQESDIQGLFVGLRVLLNNNRGHSYIMSREWKLDSPLPGLYSHLGGKFTSARIEADKTVQVLLSYLKKPQIKCPTADRKFPWCPEGDYAVWNDRIIKEGISLGLDRETVTSAAMRYGTTITKLFAVLKEKPELTERIDQNLPFCKGEMIHAEEEEMALTSEDVLRRRIPLEILGKKKIKYE